MFIYQVTNLVNRKKYIGQTRRKRPEIRWKQHAQFGMAPLACAIRKYGKEYFRFEVLLEVADQETANLVETRLIRKLHTRTPYGYNVSEGGGSIAGIPQCVQRGPNHWTARHPDRRRRGDETSSHKITNHQARLIRVLYRTRNIAGTCWNQSTLARRFGVWQSTISDIVRRESF